MNKDFKNLIDDIHQCRICAKHFDHQANPIIQLDNNARILIVGQAPGLKAHESSIPFNDASGERLRQWMAVTSETFYNPRKIALLPMGFCYPGRGSSGDLPPRKECAQTWRQQVLKSMPKIQLTLVIGMYAIDWHLETTKKENLTKTVKAWQEYSPAVIPLPHPSPRNNIWLKKNNWFERDLVPVLQASVKKILK